MQNKYFELKNRVLDGMKSVKLNDLLCRLSHSPTLLSRSLLGFLLLNKHKLGYKLRGGYLSECGMR